MQNHRRRAAELQEHCGDAPEPRLYPAGAERLRAVQATYAVDGARRRGDGRSERHDTLLLRMIESDARAGGHSDPGDLRAELSRFISDAQSPGGRAAGGRRFWAVRSGTAERSVDQGAWDEYRDHFVEQPVELERMRGREGDAEGVRAEPRRRIDGS